MLVLLERDVVYINNRLHPPKLPPRNHRKEDRQPCRITDARRRQPGIPTRIARWPALAAIHSP
jgi:hypothetical protein